MKKFVAIGVDMTKKEDAPFSPVRRAKDMGCMLHVRLRETDMEALEELKRITGEDSVSNVVRNALRTFYYVTRELENGAEITICESGGKDKVPAGHKGGSPGSAR